VTYRRFIATQRKKRSILKVPLIPHFDISNAKNALENIKNSNITVIAAIATIKPTPLATNTIKSPFFKKKDECFVKI
jgi:endonuclease III-like uncharacterized protein